MKRLFFGTEIHAPWPNSLPKGRLLDEKDRHFTLAFLGTIPYELLSAKLNDCPLLKTPMQIGISGWFDKCLFLPPQHPNVVAWQPHWYSNPATLHQTQRMLFEWLKHLGYALDTREWLPHATLCRKPFDKEEWENAFIPVPFYTGDCHLYESLGNSAYAQLHTYTIKKPFDEIEHTADIAFLVRGTSIEDLYLNAFSAIAFKWPSLISFFIQEKGLKNLDEVIMRLNECLCQADIHTSCPLKGVSFHGEAIKQTDGTLEWEMIVDV